MSMDNRQIPGSAAAVTPSDVTMLTNAVGLYVGGAGNVNVVDGAGNTVLFTAVPVGTTIWLNITQVKATSTTATNIVAFKAF